MLCKPYEKDYFSELNEEQEKELLKIISKVDQKKISKNRHIGNNLVHQKPRLLDVSQCMGILNFPQKLQEELQTFFQQYMK